MRRALFSGLGLGLVLGGVDRPALAQQGPGHTPNSYSYPARTETSARRATLGRPVAVPDGSRQVPAVTPAGLVTRGQAPATLAPLPVPSRPIGVPYGTPAMSPYPVATPAAGLAPFGQPVPGPQPGPSPRPGTPGTPSGSPPMVTEVRDPMGRIVPSPGAGPAMVVPGGPVTVPGGAMLVPPVTPCDVPIDPGYQPGAAAVTRVPGGSRAWLSAEYLLWWTKSTQLPVLGSTGMAIGPTPGQYTGAVLPIISGSFGQTLHGGARFGGGYWFGDDQVRGIDARVMFLFRNGNSFATNSNQYPVLGRPFFNINPGVPSATGNPVGVINELIGLPGVALGSLNVQLENSLWGADVNYRRNLFGGVCAPCFRLDALIGYRYLNFKEQLSITESALLYNPPPPGVPTLSLVNDQFRAENNFHGGQIGLVGEFRRGRWFIDGRASIALGSVRQTAEISGGQAMFVPSTGQSTVAQGGLLAVPGANIGTFTQNKFAVLPEVGVNFGYQVTPHLRVFAGYNFLYLSSVLRPAGVIDPVVDAGRVPNLLQTPIAPVAGVVRPTPQMRTTDFFAQGISFGLQWNFGYSPRW